ncbi:hypothetical protein WA158_001044 [Blastocystis sp. Blastoise]
MPEGHSRHRHHRDNSVSREDPMSRSHHSHGHHNRHYHTKSSRETTSQKVLNENDMTTIRMGKLIVDMRKDDQNNADELESYINVLNIGIGVDLRKIFNGVVLGALSIMFNMLSIQEQNGTYKYDPSRYNNESISDKLDKYFEEDVESLEKEINSQLSQCSASSVTRSSQSESVSESVSGSTNHRHHRHHSTSNQNTINNSTSRSSSVHKEMKKEEEEEEVKPVVIDDMYTLKLVNQMENGSIETSQKETENQIVLNNNPISNTANHIDSDEDDEDGPQLPGLNTRLPTQEAIQQVMDKLEEEKKPVYKRPEWMLYPLKPEERAVDPTKIKAHGFTTGNTSSGIDMSWFETPKAGNNHLGSNGTQKMIGPSFGPHPSKPNPLDEEKKKKMEAIYNNYENQRGESLLAIHQREMKNKKGQKKEKIGLANIYDRVGGNKQLNQLLASSADFHDRFGPAQFSQGSL